MERQRVFLVFVIYFLRSCRVSHSIGLTFDNQLVIVANDCYTRVAIGSKLLDADVSSSVAVAGISECEDECSKKRNSCNAFAFGIGIKGNGTCALSAKMPKLEELESHADYDVYLRSQHSPNCEPDRLYKMGNNGIGQKRRNETRPATRFGSGLLGPTMPSILSSPRITGSMMPNVANIPSYQQGYMPSFDDERRIADILRNKSPMPLSGNNPFGTKTEKIDNYNDVSLNPNRKSTFGQRTHDDPNDGRSNFGGPFFRNPFTDVNRLNLASNFDSDLHSYKALTVHNRPFEIFSRPILIHDIAAKNKSPTDFTFWSDPVKYRNTIANHRLNQHRDHGFFDYTDKNHGIITRPKQNELVAGNRDIGKVPPWPNIGNSYGFESNGAKISHGGFKNTPAIWSPKSSTSTFRDFGAKISHGGFKDTPATWSPGSSPGAFRDFGARITGQSKSERMEDRINEKDHENIQTENRRVCATEMNSD